MKWFIHIVKIEHQKNLPCFNWLTLYIKKINLQKWHNWILFIAAEVAKKVMTSDVIFKNVPGRTRTICLRCGGWGGIPYPQARRERWSRMMRFVGGPPKLTTRPCRYTIQLVLIFKTIHRDSQYVYSYPTKLKGVARN